MHRDKPYNDFGTWIRNRLGCRVQKISINSGCTCPNRDGTIGTGGCIYCNNKSFTPAYCLQGGSVKQQLEEGKKFFARKYPDMRYLAYFQSFTSTYASFEDIKRTYCDALDTDKVAGIVIGTRPDCMPNRLLDLLEDLNRQAFVMVEYGVETANDTTLKRINRGHTFATACDTVERTAARNITTGGHVILGLPGETAEESLRQAPIISSMKLDILKLHQLQVVKDTKLAQTYQAAPFPLYSVNDYISLVSRYIQLLREDLVLERFVSQTPKDQLIAPQWGIKNYEFTNMLVSHLKATGGWQGKMLSEGKG